MGMWEDDSRNVATMALSDGTFEEAELNGVSGDGFRTAAFKNGVVFISARMAGEPSAPIDPDRLKKKKPAPRPRLNKKTTPGVRKRPAAAVCKRPAARPAETCDEDGKAPTLRIAS